jgi:hypothetical protein
VPLVDGLNVSKDHFVLAGLEVVGHEQLLVLGVELGRAAHEGDVALDHVLQVPHVHAFGLDHLLDHELPLAQGVSLDCEGDAVGLLLRAGLRRRRRRHAAAVRLVQLTRPLGQEAVALLVFCVLLLQKRARAKF